MHATRTSQSKASTALGLLALGGLIVGITVYTILYFTAPVRPEASDVGAPKDNTPFVGKKW